jgi:hypothetical protein
VRVCLLGVEEERLRFCSLWVVCGLRVLVPVGFWVVFLRVGLGFFVLVGLGSRGFVWWVSFFLFLGFFFFDFQLCVFSCILPVY